MLYPNATSSNITKWGLETIEVKEVTYQIPSEIKELLELPNTLLVVNGSIVENNTTLQLTDGEFYQQKTNDLMSIENTLVFNVEANAEINLVNYITNTDLSTRLVFNVFSKEFRVNEIVYSNNADKVKYNVVVNQNTAYSNTVYTTVFNTIGSKMYTRYDLYTLEDNTDITFNVGEFSDSDVFVEVYGEVLKYNSTINTNAFVLANNNEQKNLLVNLINSHSSSNTNMKNYVVTNDESKVVVDGIGKILKGMSGSTAYQTTRGLILGERAECHTNPLLLIDEFDVQAGHGATVGRIDEEHLYYLMSRGLTRLEAANLIVNGYVNYLYEYINGDVLKEKIEKIVKRKLK